MKSSGGFPPGDFFAYSKKSDPAVSGFLLFEKQICIGVKDVDGVKTTNRHPKFMIRFLLSYCCRLEILTILLP